MAARLRSAGAVLAGRAAAAVARNGEDTRARIGIAVVTRNRVESLRRTLEHLRRLSGSVPTIVVDNGSTDGTAATVARDFPDVRLLRLSENRGAAARTLAAEALMTTYVAFADDDSWWAEGALDLAADVLDGHPDVAVVAARVLVGPDRRLDPTCAEMARSPLETSGARAGRRVLGFIACGAVVRRSAFLAVGGFHPRWGTGGEEVLLSIDLAARGWVSLYVEEVVAHHHPSPDRDSSRRRAVAARNRIWLGWLRLPAGRTLMLTAEAVRRAVHDPDCRRGLREALGGAAWVLRERRVVPRPLARDIAAVRI